MATATPIAVTRLTTDTVMEATSTMLDVLVVPGRSVLALMILQVSLQDLTVPVDPLRALAKGLCSAAFWFHVRGVCRLRYCTSAAKQTKTPLITKETAISLQRMRWCL